MKEGRKEGRNKNIYYKKLTFAIVIAEKSQELQLVETQKGRWFSASVNLPKTRRTNSVSSRPSLRLKAGQDKCSSWKAGREREREFLLSPFILFRLSRLDEPHPHWGGQSTLLSPPIQTLISSRNIHRHTHNMFNQIFDHPMAQSSLYYKIKYHSDSEWTI